MTDQQRTDWLAGRWVVVRGKNTNAYFVRRLEGSRCVEAAMSFPTEKKARRYADKLNTLEKTS